MRISSWLTGVLLVSILPWSSVWAKTNEQAVKVPTIINSAIIKIGENTNKQVFYEDLDGDHKTEKIVLLTQYREEEGAVEMIVKINDRVVKLNEQWMSGDPIAHIVDISIKDKVKELAIGGDLCSSDFATSFYRYEKGKLKLIGETEGVIEEVQLDKSYQMTIPGDGTINTYYRGKLLQTWYREERYALGQNNLLVMQPKKLYEMNTKVTLLQCLETYARADSNAQVSQVFEVGEQATITLTDDKIWCQIVDEQGNKGWFRADEWGNIGGTGLSSGEVFEGLFFAD